jgi:hypothetical protein
VSDRPNVNLWEVMASEPSPEGRYPGYANIRVFVVTRTAERAMELVRVDHADCIFHKVERRNNVHTTGAIIVDEEVAEIIGRA